MAGLTVISAMAGLTNILRVPMANLTVSVAMAGLTNVMCESMADLTDFPPSHVSANSGPHKFSPIYPVGADG